MLKRYGGRKRETFLIALPAIDDVVRPAPRPHRITFTHTPSANAAFSTQVLVAVAAGCESGADVLLLSGKKPMPNFYEFE